MFEHNVAHKLNVVHSIIVDEDCTVAEALAAAFPPASNSWSADLKRAVTAHLLNSLDTIPLARPAAVARDAYLTARGACL